MPAHTWVRIERFLRSVRRGSYGGLASYRPDSGPSTPMTAEALYCRMLMGEILPEAIDERAAAGDGAVPVVGVAVAPGGVGAVGRVRLA